MKDISTNAREIPTPIYVQFYTLHSYAQSHN